MAKKSSSPRAPNYSLEQARQDFLGTDPGFELSIEVGKRFVAFFQAVTDSDDARVWTPAISRRFKSWLKEQAKQGTPVEFRPGQAITREGVLQQIEAFANYLVRKNIIQGEHPLAGMRATRRLKLEQALSEEERQRVLAAADAWPTSGGLSKDKHRFRRRPPTQRQTYRPYRNRAIIYVLVEMGLTRSAVTEIKEGNINGMGRYVEITTKTKTTKHYFSDRAWAAVEAYRNGERQQDVIRRPSPYLFLPAPSVVRGKKQLTPVMIHHIWKQAAAEAKLPHRTMQAARYGVGQRIMKRTHDLVAVQQQLGYRNLMSAAPYAESLREGLLRDSLNEKEGE